MDRDRYNQISELFRRAVDLAPAERGAFLDRECGPDGALRTEVEQLLANDDDDFADELTLHGESKPPRRSADLSGKQIARYQIIELIGSGGMAEVYRAMDERLEREVALKFLSPALIGDAYSHSRFYREAKAAASLDHPNVCTVYEVDEYDGRTFIAMALLQGPTLEARIKEKPMPLAEALEVAIQVGRGLEAAHAKQIVHRDIKPSNLIYATADLSQPLVKVTDFGIARLAEQTKLTRDQTTPGTVAFMSPEQTQGSAVDARTDVWALGVVLYKMISGQLPFQGHYDKALMRAILEQEPEPLTSLRTGVPMELEWVVNKALTKNPDQRYQSALEFVVDLERLREKVRPKSASTVRTLAAPRTYFWETIKFRRLVGAVGGVALVAAGYFLAGGRPITQTPLEAVPLTSYVGVERDVTFSPDGSQAAFAWNGVDQGPFNIYAKVVGSSTHLQLTDGPEDDLEPTWSPDGRWIAFIRHASTSASVHLVSPLGGESRLLTELDPGDANSDYSVSWTADSAAIVLARGQGGGTLALWKAAIEGGSLTKLFDAAPDAISVGSAEVSRDGDTVALIERLGGTRHAIDIAAMDGGRRDRFEVADTGFWGMSWSANGKELLYSRPPRPRQPAVLWRRPVSGGEAIPLPGLGAVTEPVIAAQGARMAYERELRDANLWALRLQPGITAGSSAQLLATSSEEEARPRLSPDGARLLFVSNRSGADELWVANADGSGAAQLTALNSAVGTASWSPDGTLIAFDAGPTGVFDIYAVPATGGSPTLIVENPAEDAGPSWSADGQWIYFASNRGGSFEIWKTPAKGGEAEQVTRSGGFDPRPSPDGRFVYFCKGRFGPGVWRQPVDGGAPSAVLPGLPEASVGRWAPVDQGIYYLERENAGGNSLSWRLRYLDFATRQARLVADLGPKPIHDMRPFDISADGRLLIFTRLDREESDLMLVENFQ